MATGDVTANLTKVFGQYCSFFDGVDDWIDFSDNFDMRTNDMTITAWIKTDDAKALVGIACKSYYGVLLGRYGLTLESGKLAAIFQGSDIGTTYEVTSTTSVNNNEWHHVAVVFDRDSNMTIYVDGVAEASVNISTEDGYDMNTNSTFMLGGYNQAGAGTSPRNGNFLKGYLKNVMIFRKALTSQEILDVYNGDTTNDSLTHRYKLREDYQDSVGNIDGVNDGSVFRIVDDNLASSIASLRTSVGANGKIYIEPINNDKAINIGIEEA